MGVATIAPVLIPPTRRFRATLPARGREILSSRRHGSPFTAALADPLRRLGTRQDALGPGDVRLVDHLAAMCQRAGIRVVGK